MTCPTCGSHKRNSLRTKCVPYAHPWHHPDLTVTNLTITGGPHVASCVGRPDDADGKALAAIIAYAEYHDALREFRLGGRGRAAALATMKRHGFKDGAGFYTAETWDGILHGEALVAGLIAARERTSGGSGA